MPFSDPAELPGLLPFVLSLPRLTVMQLFTLPGDPLPQAVLRLTGLSTADVQRLLARTAPPHDPEVLLREEPLALYYFVLTGWLAYDSPLGASLADQLTELEPTARAATLNLMGALVEQLLDFLSPQLPDPTAVAATETALRAVFAQEKYALKAHWPLPALPPAAPADRWTTLRPTAPMLNLYGMALHLTVVARFGVPHPLGEALGTVPGLGPDQELVALAQRLKATAPENPLPLTGPDVVRLYLSINALALLFMADLYPTLMARLEPDAASPGPWTDPNQQQAVLTWVGVQAEALNRVFDEAFADEPAYRAAQREVQRLANLV